MFYKIVEKLDKCANSLENKGFKYEASEIDKISNTIEAAFMGGLSSNIKTMIGKLLNTPNWKEYVEAFFANKGNSDKEAKMGAIPKAVLVALTMISSAIGAQNAEDFIAKVSKMPTESSIMSEKVDQKSMQGLRDAIPFDVSNLELIALSKVSKGIFEASIKKKISKGIEGEVSEFVKSSAVFKNMALEDLSKNIGEAFIMKIKQPKYERAYKSLSKFLANNNMSEDDLKDLVKRASLEALKKETKV